MHAEYFGVILDGQLVYIIIVVLQLAWLGHIVQLAFTELVLVLQNVWQVELLENAEQTTFIEIISDPAPVVDLASHVGQGIPRDLVLFIQQHQQHCH